MLAIFSAQGCPIAKYVKCATGVLVEFREGLAADTVPQVPCRCGESERDNSHFCEASTCNNRSW